MPQTLKTMTEVWIPERDALHGRIATLMDSIQEESLPPALLDLASRLQEELVLKERRQNPN